MLPVIASFAAHQLLSNGAVTPAEAAPARVQPEPNPYANAPAPTAAQLAVIRSTVPVLAEHGVTLTTRFYARMLNANPDLKNVFNDAHQKTGAQAKALAAAVYPIVGTNLLAALEGLLTEAGFAADAVASIIDAWAAAYGQLANILITTEEKLYAAAEAQPGGWRGWRKFVVTRREAENADGSIVSFYLKPKDGGIVPRHQPGQFTCIRMQVPAHPGQVAYYQPRQYTLSAPADGATFRVTIKREDANGAVAPIETEVSGCPYARPAGVVSNLAHKLAVGSEVDLAPPFGDFVLDSTSSPVILIAAGVGITPSSAMLDSAVAAGRQVSFLYGCHNGAAQPMRDWLRAASASGKVQTRVFYSKPSEQDEREKAFDFAGRLDLAKVDDKVLQLAAADAQYYVCGPALFMQDVKAALQGRGVKPEQIHAEKFGTGSVA